MQAEAVALLKKNVYHTAPATHKMVPKLKPSDVVRGAFEERDRPRDPPPQSVSEQQVHPPSSPMHGLRIWQSLITWVAISVVPGVILTVLRFLDISCERALRKRRPRQLMAKITRHLLSTTRERHCSSSHRSLASNRGAYSPSLLWDSSDVYTRVLPLDILY